MKIVMITGGVVSGLGKGIIASSIGNLLRASGYSVAMIKMDPYLQVDAGTMSPYEHGEVFVTDDGGETDLDFGHYQRFVGCELKKNNSITTGKIYLSVINNERKGEYLGQTVQVIPHITDEIKKNVTEIARGVDVTIIEIGGTIGDIEGPHFLEAMRQLRHEIGRDNFISVHVAPLIHLEFSGETKTKAIQHSVMKLREIGFPSDLLMCRTSQPISDKIKEKLAMFTDVEKEQIIEARDEQSIYNVPLTLHEQGVDEWIQERFFGTYQRPTLDDRKKYTDQLIHADQELHVAIAGKYTHFEDCYLSVVESIKHASARCNVKPVIHRIDTTDYQDADREKKCEKFFNEKKVSAVLIPGGFGSRGVEGMINVAQYCMEKKIPYLGICLGLQVAVIAFARKFCQRSDAHSTEFDLHTSYPVVTLMNSQVEIDQKGGTMRLGLYPEKLLPETKTYNSYKIYGKEKLFPNEQHIIYERHRHRYEVNPLYHTELQKAGLILSGISPTENLVEHIEILDHPFFVATQSHPEFQSQLTQPHPLFMAWMKEICR